MSSPHALTGKPFDKDELTSRQFALFVALASSGMLFAALMLSYFLARARVPAWPPLGVEPVPPLIPLLSIPVLAIISGFLHLAWKRWLAADLAGFRKAWTVASIAGTAFLGLQVGLWIHLSQLGIRVDANLFSSVIWVLTVVHATHVLVAVALLWRLQFRILRPDGVRALSPESPRLVGYFWHFLDAVWIILVASLLW